MKRALEMSPQDAARRKLRRSMRASIEKYSGAALRVAPDNQALAETIDGNWASLR
jgi:hypothetical protein